MIRNPRILRWMMLVSPSTVLHVGAHYGQDRRSYLLLGVKEIIWGEASKAAAAKLRARFPEDKVVEGIFWDKSGLQMNFFESVETQNSSAIKPINLESFSLISGLTVTVDEVMSQKSSSDMILIVLDVQGAEMNVLKGATETLKRAKYIVIEIALHSQGYEIAPTEKEFDTFMKNQGFTKSIDRVSHDGSYKDQLYIKNRNQKRLIEVVDYITKVVRKRIHAIRFFHIPTSQYNCEICNAAR